MKNEGKKYAELFIAVSTDIEEAAIKAWEADARHNPNPNNPHAYRNGFRAGAKEVIYNPEKYGLILYEDANQLFDKRADESAMAFRKMRDELKAENQRLREALERAYNDFKSSRWTEETYKIVIGALKQEEQ